MGRPVAWIGVLLFAVAWFVPTMKGQELLGMASELGSSLDGGMQGLEIKKTETSGPFGKGGLPSGPSWLPGWQACSFAWTLLTEGGGDAPDAWKARVLGATCLTNLLMGLTIVLLLGQKSGNPVLALVLLGAVALNASWIYLGGGEGGKSMAEGLSAGYYLWTASFLVVGVGLLGGRKS